MKPVQVIPSLKLTIYNSQMNDKRNFNVNTFLKSVSTSKSRVTYDLDTDRVTYDLDIDLGTTTHKIIGVVGSPLYLRPSEISSFTVVENVFTFTVQALTQTAEFFGQKL